MPNPNVTIRQARRALSLLIEGGLRQIEASSANDAAIRDATINLFDELADEMDDWEIESSEDRKLRRIRDKMHELLANEDCPNIVRELLASCDLLP